MRGKGWTNFDGFSGVSAEFLLPGLASTEAASPTSLPPSPSLHPGTTQTLHLHLHDHLHNGHHSPEFHQSTSSEAILTHQSHISKDG